MVKFSSQEVQQDSIRVRNTPIQDSVMVKPVSSSIISSIQQKDSVSHRIFLVPKRNVLINTDTTSFCTKNRIADITFYDSSNVVTRIEPFNYDRFPLLFTEKNKNIEAAELAALVRQLKPGLEIPFQPLHDDWIILIILFATFLFSLVRRSSRNMLPAMMRFILFLGINDPYSRDTGGIFNLESTIKNLISFLILGLFGYFAASYNNIIPSTVTGILFWLISVLVVIMAVTLRHIVCIITGSASGQRDVFMEYLLGVYQSYRFSALFMFIIIILMSYTTILSVKSSLTVGIILFATLYMIRIMRLFIIFINRNISIFYLILYLCALEILPVVISVKFISDLV